VREVAGSMGFGTTPERPVRKGEVVMKEVTPPKKVDPRSPATKGEVGAIIRSIDDVL